MLEWLEDATRDPHGGDLSIAVRTHPKGCLHTTEGPGWPDYQGWSIPPHVTVRPVPGSGVEVRQHIPFSRASFALENAPGGVETNRADVFQVEMIGTCDPAQKGHLYYWPEADDVVLASLYRKVVKPMSDGLGIPLVSLRWLAYPASYGAANGVRLQGPAWLAYSGWHGHQHAAENHHGDPGAFPWARLIALGGDDVALTDAEIDAIATRTRDKVLAATYGTATLAGVIGEIRINAGKAAAGVLDVDALAEAIVAKLPPAATGGLTEADVRQAVAAVLATAHA